MIVFLGIGLVPMVAAYGIWRGIRRPYICHEDPYLLGGLASVGLLVCIFAVVAVLPEYGWI